jgi:DNA primase
MTNKKRSLSDLATKCHKGLPERIRQYLNGRGIPDEMIDLNLIGWNGWRITIPIFNREGQLVFFKQVRDPENQDGPKMIAWPKGYLELYGWENLTSETSRIIICEGEFDRLVLEANGFKAATSTAGARAFKREWAKEFETIPEVHICFDNDEAGRKGALRVGSMIPHAKIMDLPTEVGEGGDVTDFFARLGKTREDFLTLREDAKPAPPAEESLEPKYVPIGRTKDPLLSERVERVKNLNPIKKIVGQYVTLKPAGVQLSGLCPFHKDHMPSLIVYPSTGTFFCYGCGKHGDVITFVREMEHLNFGQALDALDRFNSQNGS